ncbi:DUF1059 domain-containing protein [Bordetella bronchiseptica]|uniref:DUF1059 domain-containing protein n=1 Tax=Bordetella bronchiseptica TaxID=518 RepID=UPI003F4F6350
MYLSWAVARPPPRDAELLEAAVQHATTVHKHADTPELRAQLKTMFHEGTPPLAAQAGSRA